MDDLVDAGMLDRIRDSAVEIVNQRFESKRQVTLLSFLGQTLSRRGIDFKSALGGKGLADFLKEAAAGQIAIQSAPNDAKVMVAYPASTDLTKEVDPYGFRPTDVGEKGVPRAKRELLIDEIWRAFTNPLAEKTVRCIELGDPPRWEDSPEGSDCLGITIEREYVITAEYTNKYVRNSAVYESISRWCEKHDVDFQKLINKRPQISIKKSLLEAVLHAWRNEDLGGVALPLNLVAILANTRV